MISPKRKMVTTHFSLVESHRAFTENPFMDGNGPCDVFSFGFFVHFLIIQPSVSMTSHFPILLFTECMTHHRISFQCHTHGKYRDRDFALSEETMESPKPRTGTVVIESFHVEMTFIVCHESQRRYDMKHGNEIRWEKQTNNHKSKGNTT